MRNTSTTSHRRRTFRTLTLVALFLACSPTGEDTSGLEASRDSARPPRDNDRLFASLDICSHVPVAEVAGALGHQPGTGSAKATMGGYATDCTYSFERGDGSSEHVMIWAYPPELWASELKEGIQEVAGLGDAANLTSLSSFAQMNVLLEGDLYIDTRAKTPDEARALAELALERLTDTQEPRDENHPIGFADGAAGGSDGP